MRVDPVEMLKTRVKQAGSQKNAALEMGISTAYLSDLINKRRGVGDKMLKILGLRIVYERMKP